MTFTKPAVIADNDIMLLAVYLNNTTATLSTPTNWNYLGDRASTGAHRVYYFWKRAASEGASWSLSASTNVITAAVLWACTGGKLSGSPISAHHIGDSTTAPLTVADYSGGLVDDQCYEVILSAAWSGSITWSAITGWTTQTATTSSSSDPIAAFDRGPRSTGAQGTASVTYTGGSSTNLIAARIAIIPEPDATYEQEGFRWRDDDNNEALAAWLAAQDTNISRNLELNTRLRMLVNATGNPASQQYQLEYRQTTGSGGDGVWRKVE
jgi:hypothetical protein